MKIEYFWRRFAPPFLKDIVYDMVWKYTGLMVNFFEQVLKHYSESMIGKTDGFLLVPRLQKGVFENWD